LDDPAPLRQQLDLQGAPILYCPRAMHPIYNLDILLHALPIICVSFPEVLLVLRDYNTDLNYRAQLEDLIKRLNLAQCVRIIPRGVWEKMVGLYQAADLALSIPSSDSTPVSLLEAMACGAPIIATDLPALREWIQPGENGLLVPVRDAQALAGSVIELWNNPDQRARFRQANLRLVKERADHQVEMRRMERLYQSLMPGQANSLSYK
jgi:glycosyltransferase involved in cell wall biosynthesis